MQSATHKQKQNTDQPQLFDESDSDGSGMIDMEEFRGMVKRLEESAGGEKVQSDMCL